VKWLLQQEYKVQWRRKLYHHNGAKNSGVENTPFLEYQRLGSAIATVSRAARGYDDIHYLWDTLKQIEELGAALNIRDIALRRSSLYVGPCPGLWRAFYAATADAQTDEILSLKKYLGLRLPLKISRRQLGMRFDRWIRMANRAYNAFLESSELKCFARLKGDVRRYYERRAGEHSTFFNVSSRKVTKMTVDCTIEVWPSVPLHEMKPDGIFAEGKRAALFESKLSDPSYEEFALDMAAYAMAIEHALKKDVDHAIILHSDYPRGRIRTKVYGISDSDVAEVTANVERFLRLVQDSYVACREQLTEQRNQSRRLQSWKAFLVRPPGFPDKSAQGPCPKCKYRSLCLEAER